MVVGGCVEGPDCMYVRCMYVRVCAFERTIAAARAAGQGIRPQWEAGGYQRVSYEIGVSRRIHLVVIHHHDQHTHGINSFLKLE